MINERVGLNVEVLKECQVSSVDRMMSRYRVIHIQHVVKDSYVEPYSSNGGRVD